MRRLLIALLAVMLVLSWAPMKAAQAASIIKTEDGLEFKFGLVQKTQMFTLNGADFTSNVPTAVCGSSGQCNFHSFVSPDTNVGDSTWNVWNFTNLLFDLSKGPVSIHINLENEAVIDENIADINHLNLERAALTWKTPGFGDLTVGFDVHLLDPEGGLIYADEDPGIWLVGSDGPWSWNFAYFKRLSRNRGKPLGNLIGGATFNPGTGQNVHVLDNDTDFFQARVGFNIPLGGGNNISIAPVFLADIRHTPAEFAPGTNLASCPTNGLGAGLTCNNMPQTNPGRAELYYPGLVITSKFGPLNFTFEGVGQFGTMRFDAPGSTSTVYQKLYNLAPGDDSVSIESYALFGEIALDLTAQGIGITPYANVDYRKGDSDPLNDTLGGYVAQSDLTQALRKDGFHLQSIQSVGAVTLGNGGDDGWGFNTSGRGLGPTVGTILEGFGADTSQFNARWGKADNPGMLKVSAGALGKVNSQWDTHFGFSYIWFDTTEPIQVEAAQNRISRNVNLPAGCPATPGVPVGTPDRKRIQCVANTISISSNAGYEFNFNVGYSPVPAFRIQPFVSVFVPQGGAGDIQDQFLGSGTGSADSTRTAYMAGVEFRAQF